MNLVVLVGRLTKDPDVNGKSVRFSLAIDRKFKNKDGQYDTDFPNCVAFGKTGEFIQKYFSKGMKIGITGRIQTGSYQNKEGKTVYTTDVVVDSAEFVESKNANAQAAPAVREPAKPKDNSFMDIPDSDDDELPFN